MKFLKSLAASAGYVLLATAVCAASSASAQTPPYPAKPVKIIVPFTPGGGNDAFARQVGQILTEAWKQQVVIENRPGAGGNIGTAAAAKSAPDGYTLLLGHTGTLAINPGLYGSKLPYDPQKDFVPISLVASTPLVLVVPMAEKSSSLKELIALAKTKPEQINYASSGSGTGSHLSGELLERMAGVKLTHIPYKGTGPATADLLGGQVQMMFAVIPTALPHVKGGRLKAIAVTGPSRLPQLPNVPTMIEAGLPGYESTLSYGILAPRGTPEPIVREIQQQLSKAVASPKLKEMLAAEGAVPLAGTGTQFASLIKAETEKWGKVIKEGGIQAD
ncbi:MAG: Tripartite-type tricarboxylate transporter, receptor component TctC [Noviherbaspirillum sp.]|jgi:tripartite-type tricarboxylate transporter receptor subunit TctC|nr:Tripartite-type tricarboxylate transporter, receptor component TctC [Noviherbaspirillum sp.]